jgi:hypothetical protein
VNPPGRVQGSMLKLKLASDPICPCEFVVSNVFNYVNLPRPTM